MKRLLALIAAGGAGVVGYRRSTTDDVSPSLDAERTDLPFGEHTIATYRRGAEGGAPVVLIHSVNAAASAAEMRPLFDRLSADRRVVALDLLGYGRSSRPAQRHPRVDGRWHRGRAGGSRRAVRPRRPVAGM